MPTPDFSPTVLKAFLRARIIFAAPSFGGNDGKAHRAQIKALRAQTRLPRAAIEAAHAGRLIDAASRAQIWGALGIAPADHGVMLLDDGGQEPPSVYLPVPKDAAPQWTPSAQAALDDLSPADGRPVFSDLSPDEGRLPRKGADARSRFFGMGATDG